MLFKKKIGNNIGVLSYWKLICLDFKSIFILIVDVFESSFNNVFLTYPPLMYFLKHHPIMYFLTHPPINNSAH